MKFLTFIFLSFATLAHGADVTNFFSGQTISSGDRVGNFTAGGEAYDTDAQDYFDRVTANSGTLTDAEKTALNTFVVNTKSSGVWDKIYDCGFMNVGDSNASLVKLKWVATNLLTVTNTLTFVEGFGYQGANSGWLKTGVIPNDHGMVATNQSFSVLTPTRNMGASSIHGGGNTYIGFYTAPTVNTNYIWLGKLGNVLTNFAEWGPPCMTITIDGANEKTYDGGVLASTRDKGASATTTEITLLGYNGGSLSIFRFGISAYLLGTNLSQTDVQSWYDESKALSAAGLAENLTTNTAAFLGDSITDAPGYVTNVAARIGKTAINQGFSGYSIGNNYPTTGSGASLWNFAFPYALTNKSKTIYIMYGVNDKKGSSLATTNLNLMNPTNFYYSLDHFVELLLEKGWEPEDIHLGSPPLIDCSVAEAKGCTEALEQEFEDMVESVAIKYGTWYAPIYTYMKNNGGLTLLGGDGIHPNTTGHEVIADAWMTETLK